MRPIDPIRHANVGNAVSETRFRLDAASTAHLVGVLTNLYSDRIQAFIRELSTNAADSHISARNNAPIRVTLPTRSNPVFVVEDFGLGLNIDDLTETYSAYGASSKRDDDEVNGTLGLGSKAPLAYADTFTIRARKGGVQVLAVVTKDHDGVPVLKVLDTSATAEPNGVRIEVPVKDRDIFSVKNTAETFFEYWEKGTVLVDGEQPANVRDDSSLVWLDDDVAVALNRRDSVIVQHNVAYPVDSYRLSLPYEVIAFVPSGTVNFPPSREALEYTERTTEVLDLLADYARDAFDRKIREQVAAATTTYERLKLVQVWRQYVPNVAQDFFGKHGLSIRFGGHGIGWRYEPQAYHRKATQITRLNAADIIGEFPIITGYERKTLTPKVRAKIAAFFEDTDHRRFYFLPPETNLDIAEGRQEIYTWAEIDATIPDATVATATAKARKGQTLYSVHSDGSWDTLTLKEAKEAIADLGSPTVVHTTGSADHYRSLLPDAVIFDIKPNQIDKIERETGARPAYAVVAERLAAARAALTAADRRWVALRTSGTDLFKFAPVIDRVADPVVREIISVNQEATPVTVQAYLNLGGRLGDENIADPAVRSEIDEVTTRYPLIDEVPSYRFDRSVGELLIYMNAKYQQVSAAAEIQTTSSNNQETI